MAGKSNIQWTNKTWNPIVGCSIVSPGCRKCYAMIMAARIEAMTAALRKAGKTGAGHYDGTTKKVNGNPVWTGKLAQAPQHILLEPLSWREPARIFVNSMGDLFHEDAADEWIDLVFAVMALSPQHQFQVLTKRAERMRAYLAEGRERTQTRWLWAARGLFQKFAPGETLTGDWPLPNVWLGVSAERQKEADERIPLLLETPAAIRFVSCEPLLGAIDLRQSLAKSEVTRAGERVNQWLQWVIVGGESGNDVVPFEIGFARKIIADCKAADVGVFMKQLGSRPFERGEPSEWPEGIKLERDGLIHWVTGFRKGKGRDPNAGDPAQWPADLRVREFPEALGV